MDSENKPTITVSDDIKEAVEQGIAELGPAQPQPVVIPGEPQATEEQISAVQRATGDMATINRLITDEVTQRAKALDDKTLDNLLAMSLVVGYGVAQIDDKWEDFVPKLAVPLLRYMGTEPAGDAATKEARKGKKKGMYSLQQKHDAERALKRLPYLFATYADILNKVANDQRKLREAEKTKAAANG